MNKQDVVIVRHQAQVEVEAIYDHQLVIDPARAERFHAAWQACLEHLGKNPSRAIRKGSYGHELLHKLPFRVVYEVRGMKVVIFKCGTPVVNPARNSGHNLLLGQGAVRA